MTTKSATKKSTKSAPAPKPTAATKRVRAEYDVKDAALVAKLRADLAAVAVEEAPVAVAVEATPAAVEPKAAPAAVAVEAAPVAVEPKAPAKRKVAKPTTVAVSVEPKPEAKPVVAAVAAEPKAPKAKAPKAKAAKAPKAAEPKAPKAPDALMQLCVAHIEAVHAARKAGEPVPAITTETVRDALLELPAAKALLADKPGDKVWGALSRLRRANLISWSWARPRVRSYSPAAR